MEWDNDLIVDGFKVITNEMVIQLLVEETLEIAARHNK